MFSSKTKGRKYFSVFPPPSPHLHTSLLCWFFLTSKCWGIIGLSSPTASFSPQMLGNLILSHGFQYPLYTDNFLIYICSLDSPLSPGFSIVICLSQTSQVWHARNWSDIHPCSPNLLPTEALQWRAIPSFQLLRSKASVVLSPLSFSHATCCLSISKSCWLYFQDIHRIWSLLTNPLALP